MESPKTEIEFACDPHRKGEERKSRFFERDFLPDPLIVSGWGVKFFLPPAFEQCSGALCTQASCLLCDRVFLVENRAATSVM